MNNTITKIESINELNSLANKNQIYIYGAGRMSYALVLYIRNILQKDIIKEIIVSDKQYNPDSVMGLNVASLNEIELNTDAVIVVATFEKSHDAINSYLKAVCLEKVFLSDDVYKEMRDVISDFSVDILNNTQWIRDDILRLNKRLDKIEQIIQKLNSIHKDVIWMKETERLGVRLYEETISPDNYNKYLSSMIYERCGYVPDIDNPRTFNEKIQWIKLYGINSQMKNLVDKYRVREWVKQQCGDGMLIPLLGVWDKFEDIDFEKLPRSFVLKCNHGSGMNAIVKDKESLSTYWLKKKFDSWMETNFAYKFGLELQYKDINPKIIAEEYLENDENELFDYKFWCFGGHCEFIMFLSERKTGLKMDNFDREWNHLDFTYDYPNSNRKIEKPSKLNEMIKIAEKLAKDFPFVRVDLYLLNDGTIKFGEMTFTPDSGLCKWSDYNVDIELGKMIDLPK